MKYIKKLILFLIALTVIGCSQQNQSVNATRILSQANNGNAIAQNNLGSYYQFGDIKNIPIDYKKSVKWYKKSANQNYPMAKVNLGYMYDMGFGVEKNKKRAVMLYEEASNSGEPRGMINLGEMYRTGDAVKKSNIKAYKWFDLARFYTQFSKDKQAKWTVRRAIVQLEERMSSIDIQKAKELAKIWLKKNK